MRLATSIAVERSRVDIQLRLWYPVDGPKGLGRKERLGNALNGFPRKRWRLALSSLFYKRGGDHYDGLRNVVDRYYDHHACSLSDESLQER